MYVLQLSTLVPLHYQHGFHSRLGYLNRLLRYFLGGERPTQTAHQILFPGGFSARIRAYSSQERYFTGDSRLPESALQSLPSMLRMRKIRPISSYSKASRVFSSNCRKPASSPVLYFHRANPRDSSPVVTPFNASELRDLIPPLSRGTDYIFI